MNRVGKSFYLGFLYVLIIAVTFSSCGKKWKETTTVQIAGGTSLSSNKPSWLSIDSGYIEVVEVEFEGERKQGKDVIFEKETYAKYDFANIGSQFILLEIPQGTYTTMEFEFEVPGSDVAPTFVLKGAFTSSTGESIPVIFESSAAYSIEIRAKTSSGSEDIVLVEGVPATASFKIDPYYCFGTIAQSIMEQAVVTINNQKTILINSEINEDLYELITARITSSASLLIK